MKRCSRYWNSLLVYLVAGCSLSVATAQEDQGSEELAQWSPKDEVVKKLGDEFRGVNFCLRPPTFLKRVDTNKSQNELPKGFEMQIWTPEGTVPSATSLVVAVAPLISPAERDLESAFESFRSGITQPGKNKVDFPAPRKGKLGNIEGRAGKFYLPATKATVDMIGSYLFFVYNDHSISVMSSVPKSDENSSQAKELRSAMLTIQLLQPVSKAQP
jgi:hypothetical protein